jgi:hypothetical protein
MFSETPTSPTIATGYSFMTYLPVSVISFFVSVGSCGECSLAGSVLHSSLQRPCMVSQVRLRVSHGDVNLYIRLTADFCMMPLVKSHSYPNVSSKLQSSTGTALYIHLRTLTQSALSIVHQNTDNTMANPGNNIEVDNDMVCLRRVIRKQASALNTRLTQLPAAGSQ